MVEVATGTKKRKTSRNVAENDADNVTVSPVVRRTRSQITQQVILHIRWLYGVMVYLLIGNCFCLR